MLTEGTAERYVVDKMEKMGYEIEVMFSELNSDNDVEERCDVHIRYRDNEDEEVYTATWCVWEESGKLYGEW